MIVRAKHLRGARPLILLLLVMWVAALQGCSERTVYSPELMPIEAVFEGTPERVDKEFIGEEKRLRVAAEVELPDSKRLGLITLVPDEDGAKRMAEELILSGYDKVSHPSAWAWYVPAGDTMLASFSVEPDNWSASYIDVAADLSGSYLEEERLFSFQHITDITPAGIQITGEDAGKIVSDYFEDYSELDFAPYRVLGAESSTGEGFYTVWAQAAVGGAQICPKMDGGPGLGLRAWISQQKIFSFQSVFLLKQTESESLSGLVPLESALGQLEKSFFVFTGEENVEIDKIILEYYAIHDSDGSYLLRPVWSFYGRAEAEGFAAPIDYLFSYFADDGALCHAGPLFY